MSGLTQNELTAYQESDDDYVELTVWQLLVMAGSVAEREEHDFTIVSMHKDFYDKVFLKKPMAVQ